MKRALLGLQPSLSRLTTSVQPLAYLPSCPPMICAGSMRSPCAIWSPSARSPPLELAEERAIARIEAANPVLNAVSVPLPDMGRAIAADPMLPRGPFYGVPFLLKDTGTCQAEALPLYMGNGLLRSLDWRAPSDAILGARFRAAGLRHRRQDGAARVRLPTDRPADRLRRVPKPVGHRALHCGIKRRCGRRRRRRPARAGGACQRHRRLDPATRGVVRGRRPEAIAPGRDSLADRRPKPRRARDHPQRAQHRHPGRRGADPTTSTTCRRPKCLHDDDVDAAGDLQRVSVDSVRRCSNCRLVDADCVAAVTQAAELLEALGHQVEPNKPQRLFDEGLATHHLRSPAGVPAHARRARRQGDDASNRGDQRPFVGTRERWREPHRRFLLCQSKPGGAASPPRYRRGQAVQPCLLTPRRRASTPPLSSISCRRHRPAGNPAAVGARLVLCCPLQRHRPTGDQPADRWRHAAGRGRARAGGDRPHGEEGKAGHRQRRR